MDPSLVVLLCVFTLSVVAHGALAGYQWHHANQRLTTATQLLSSAVESCRQLEVCVRQRSSMADEVAALREPLRESAVRSALVLEKLDHAINEMAANLITVPKMIEALAEVGKNQLQIVEQTQKTAKILYQALYSKDTKRQFRSTDPEAADLEYETQQYMQEMGMSRAEAEDQVRHDRTLSGFRVTR